MAKTDAETIDDWAKQRTVARREKNLVALLAVRGEIESGLDAVIRQELSGSTFTSKGEYPASTVLF